MPADPLSALVAAVFDPTAARPSGRLRPVVVGWPLVRLPRRRREREVSRRSLRVAIASPSGIVRGLR